MQKKQHKHKQAQPQTAAHTLQPQTETPYLYGSAASQYAVQAQTEQSAQSAGQLLPPAPQLPGPPPCSPPPPGPPRPPLRLPFLEGLIPGMDSGDVLVVLEAMKMENEILAPRDGTVAQVVTTKGAVVDTGAPLVVLA